jgi:hypothetical protein
MFPNITQNLFENPTIASLTKNLAHWKQFLQNPISKKIQNIWTRTHNLQIMK